jgi:hypothetical protein
LVRLLRRCWHSLFRRQPSLNKEVLEEVLEQHNPLFRTIHMT